MLKRDALNLLGLIGCLFALLGVDDLKRELRKDYFNSYTVTGSHGGLRYFSPTNTNLVTTDQGIFVRRMTLDNTANTSEVLLTLQSTSSPGGTASSVRIAAGASVVLEGHKMTAIRVLSGPTASEPLHVTVDR